MGCYTLNVIIFIISASLNGNLSDHCFFGYTLVVISFSSKHIGDTVYFTSLRGSSTKYSFINSLILAL